MFWHEINKKQTKWLKLMKTTKCLDFLVQSSQNYPLKTFLSPFFIVFQAPFIAIQCRYCQQLDKSREKLMKLTKAQ